MQDCGATWSHVSWGAHLLAVAIGLACVPHLLPRIPRGVEKRGSQHGTASGTLRAIVAKTALVAFMVVSAISGFSRFYLTEEYARTMPRAQQPEAQRVCPYRIHNQLVFVTNEEVERTYLYAAVSALSMAGVFLSATAWRRSGGRLASTR